MTSNWGSYSPLEGWAKNTTMGNYSPSSSTASIGGGGVDYNQNTAMNLINDPIGSMRFAQQGWGGDPSKSGGMGGSSFGAGDLINGLLGFLGTMQQMKIAKKQLALGKEQLASSKASYATDALTQAEQHDRENKTRSMKMAIDPESYRQSLSLFNVDPGTADRAVTSVNTANDYWKQREDQKLLQSYGVDIGGLMGDWAKAAGAKPLDTSTTTALASYGQPTQALTDQTNTAPTTAVKKPEEQTVRA
jgi:hypothetical protein